MQMTYTFWWTSSLRVKRNFSIFTVVLWQWIISDVQCAKVPGAQLSKPAVFSSHSSILWSQIGFLESPQQFANDVWNQIFLPALGKEKKIAFPSVFWHAISVILIPSQTLPEIKHQLQMLKNTIYKNLHIFLLQLPYFSLSTVCYWDNSIVLSFTKYLSMQVHLSSSYNLN